MPNYCYNYLRINGSKESIKQITDIIDAEKLKGEAGKVFIPLVGMADGFTEETYETGWYQHNLDRFGCKWDVNASEWEYDSDGKELVISFDTAWSPATGFAQLLVDKYGVEVRLEYNESGCYFAGYFVAGPDTEPEDHCYDYMEGLYHTDKEEFWHRFGTNIWDSFDDADEDNPPATIEELLADPEYSFFDEEDKENARRHYEAQKADVLKYLEENGTLEERLEKHRESIKKES